jgi:hypothetical protein
MHSLTHGHFAKLFAAMFAIFNGAVVDTVPSDTRVDESQCGRHNLATSMSKDLLKDQFKNDLAYVNEITQELLRVSDRARAVLLGAEIDRFLKQILDAYFLPKGPRSGRLLESTGPLGTLTARIEATYRLGLLRPEWHHDLQIVSEIRNQFAHGSVGMTLNTQSARDLCNNLIYGKKWIEHGRKLDPRHGDNPQTRFVATGIVLLGHLCIVRSKVKPAPEVWKSYPEGQVSMAGAEGLSL